MDNENVHHLGSFMSLEEINDAIQGGGELRHLSFGPTGQPYGVVAFSRTSEDYHNFSEALKAAARLPAIGGDKDDHGPHPSEAPEDTAGVVVRDPSAQ